LLFFLLFAILLWMIAQAEEDSIVPDSSFATCMKCAWQSLTTVGYGVVSPRGFWANLVTSIGVVLSLVYDAIGIGVIYQNLTNAHRKVRFVMHSTVACICRANPKEGIPMRLECRAHHLGDHALVEPCCRLTLVRWRSGQGGIGRVAIQFQELDVGLPTRPQISNVLAFLQFPWSVVHYIDESSPLREYIAIDEVSGAPMPTGAMARDHVEVIFSTLGTAASTGNAFESRTSYITKSIRFGERFEDALLHDPHSTTSSLRVDLSRLSETVPEDPDNLLLPQCYG